MHFIDFNSMDDRFRLCDEGENGDRMNGGSGRQRRGTDALRHVRESAAVSVMSISGLDLIVASVMVAMMMFRTFAAVAAKASLTLLNPKRSARKPPLAASERRGEPAPSRKHRARVGEHL